MTCWLCDAEATEASGLCGYCEQHATNAVRWAHDHGLKHYHYHWCPDCGTRWMHETVVKCKGTLRCTSCANKLAVELLGEPTIPEVDPTQRGMKREKRIAVVVKPRWGKMIRGKGKDR